jgi:hypothetical protein
MIVYLYFKNTKILKIVKTNYCSFYILVYFSWKTYEGTPIQRPIKKFLLKTWPIFFKFWMLTCIWCFWYVVFEYLMKRKGKEKVDYFFHKIKISPNKKMPTNLWIWTHILVLERQLTSNLYFFQLFRCCTKN